MRRSLSKAYSGDSYRGKRGASLNEQQLSRVMRTNDPSPPQLSREDVAGSCLRGRVHLNEDR